MKKFLYLFLSFLMLMGMLAACAKKTEAPDKKDHAPTKDDEEDPELSALEEARKLIAKEKYQEAYDLLYELEEPTEEEKDLLACFAFKELTISLK